MAPNPAGVYFIQLLLFLAFVGASLADERATDRGDPMQVVQAYLRAVYARDFIEAYRYISTQDRKMRPLDRYVQQRGAFAGFILEATKKLSESLEIKTHARKTAADRTQLVIRYRAPDPNKLAPNLLNWDPYRLNALGAAERKQILAVLEKKQQDRSLDMNEGEERFELVKEASGWRIFLNWEAGVKIPLRLDLSKASDLEVTLSKQEIGLQPGEMFEIHLKIKNKTAKPLTARIGHLVEPDVIANYLDFVQCGFLLPVTIQPGAEQEYFGSYLLRGSLPEGVHQLNLTYDFRILQ
jgi:Cytochrome c oxidase assembly protein CtaG/Cox11